MRQGAGVRMADFLLLWLCVCPPSQDLEAAVKCPPGEDRNEWLAVNTVQFCPCDTV